ncbi:hypothetical protein ACXR0O_14520 [Verrucomicrobiota bacterium sgz303538]
MSDQSDTPEPVGKIIAGHNGLGTVTPEMVEERARELARMDGRTEPNGNDRQRAHEELLGPEPDVSGPEVVDPEIEKVVTWDEAPEESGSRAPQVLPEDEANIAETLVQEGLEEAEHDQRLSSAEENPPEQEES